MSIKQSLVCFIGLTVFLSVIFHSSCLHFRKDVSNSTVADSVYASLESVTGFIMVRIDTSCVYGDCTGYAVTNYYFQDSKNDSIYTFQLNAGFDSCSININASNDPIVKRIEDCLEKGARIDTSSIHYLNSTFPYPCRNFSNLWARSVIRDGFFSCPLFRLRNSKSSARFIVFTVSGRCIKIHGNCDLFAMNHFFRFTKAMSSNVSFIEYRFHSMTPSSALINQELELSEDIRLKVSVKE